MLWVRNPSGSQTKSLRWETLFVFLWVRPLRGCFAKTQQAPKQRVSAGRLFLFFVGSPPAGVLRENPTSSQTKSLRWETLFVFCGFVPCGDASRKPNRLPNKESPLGDSFCFLWAHPLRGCFAKTQQAPKQRVSAGRLFLFFVDSSPTGMLRENPHRPLAGTGSPPTRPPSSPRTRGFL